MAIQIIRETERNRFEYDESVFYYRRIPMSKSMEINRKHTKRGLIDSVSAGLEMLEWCLLDWENVLDENKSAIPFSKDLVRFLPDELVNEISMVLREASPEKGDSVGN